MNMTSPWTNWSKLRFTLSPKIKSINKATKRSRHTLSFFALSYLSFCGPNSSQFDMDKAKTGGCAFGASCGPARGFNLAIMPRWYARIDQGISKSWALIFPMKRFKKRTVANTTSKRFNRASRNSCGQSTLNPPMTIIGKSRISFGHAQNSKLKMSCASFLCRKKWTLFSFEERWVSWTHGFGMAVERLMSQAKPTTV